MNKADEKRYTKDQVDLALMAADLKTVKEKEYQSGARSITRKNQILDQPVVGWIVIVLGVIFFSLPEKGFF